jgi:hypothetical protein
MNSQGKTVIFTVTTNGYKFLTWNLWLSIQRLAVPWNLVIVCLDKESHRFFSQIAAIPSMLLPEVQLQLQGDTTKVASHGTGDFNRITKLKLSAFAHFLKDRSIERLLYLDSDIVLFRDPVAYLETTLTQEHPLWFQCDEHTPEFTCKKENDGVHCGNCCTGVIGFWLGTPELQRQHLTMISYEESLWKQCKENNDQEYIQMKMKNHSIVYDTFQRSLFPNGSFLRNDHWKSLETPYLLHFNFIVGSNKQRVMKSKGFWYVPY